MDTSPFPDVTQYIKETESLIATGRAGAHLLRRIELDSLHLEQALKRFTTLRNACVPLLRMPPEILAEITDSLKQIWPIKHEDNGGKLEWITLTQICHQLRLSLLDRGELWAQSICVFHDSRSSRQTMLERSAAAPIVLRPRPTSGIAPDDIDFVLEHLPRARIVDIDVSDWNRDEGTGSEWVIEPASFSLKSLPLLEELSLTLDGITPQMNLLTQDIHDLPPPVTPHLKTLRLHFMLISFNPTTLTTLSIQFDPDSPRFYTPSSFLDLLRQCTLLQDLSLEYSIPFYPSLSTDPSLAELPALKRLEVQDEANFCLGFWNHICVPSSCSTVFHVHGVQEYFDEHCAHLNAIPAHFGAHARDAPVVGLSFWDASYTGWHNDMPRDTTACWFVSDPEWSNPTWTGPFQRGYREQLSLYMYSLDNSDPHFLDLMQRGLAFTNINRVEVLEIGSEHPYNPARWCQSLSPFIHVNTLYLENMKRAPLLLSLIPPAAESQDGSASLLPLPGLRYLWLQHLDLNETTDEGTVRGPDRVQFIHMLSARARMGSPIEHLRIDELHMDPTQAEKSFLPRVRTIVPLVDCLIIRLAT